MKDDFVSFFILLCVKRLGLSKDQLKTFSKEELEVLAKMIFEKLLLRSFIAQISPLRLWCGFMSSLGGCCNDCPRRKQDYRKIYKMLACGKDWFPYEILEKELLNKF